MFAVMKPVKDCGMNWEGCCCLPLPAEGTDLSQTNSYEIYGLESDFMTGSSKRILVFPVSISPTELRNDIFWKSQRPRGLSCRAARLLRSWVRIPPGAWMFVCCECCMLSQRSLRRADHSSRGVLPTVARRCVWSRNLIYEERNINQLWVKTSEISSLEGTSTG